LNDGLSEKEILKYCCNGDEYDRMFISFCSQFGIENNFLERKNNNDRYSLTLTGKEFVSSQFWLAAHV